MTNQHSQGQREIHHQTDHQLENIMGPSASEVYHQLIKKLRLSNLNFLLSETPYSAQIIIRKRFLKDVTCPDPCFDVKAVETIRNDYEILKESNCMLKTEISELRMVSEREKETIAILEEKLGKAEAAALKSFEKTKIELATLKNANKGLSNNLEEIKKENSLKNKQLKQKEKEIKKSDVKCENLSSNLKEVKQELKCLKQERIKYSNKKFANHEKATESNNNLVETDESDPGLATTDQLQHSRRPPSPRPRAQSTHTPPGTPPPRTSPSILNTPAPAITSALTTDTSGMSASSSGEASIDKTENLDAASLKSTITVQAKLKEARDGGTKLDYESLVALLKNHPWEETHEQLENEEEDDNFYYDYYSDEYEENIDEIKG